MDGKNLVFLHLSDIHFRRGSGGRYDIDEDLRNELLLDVGQRAGELTEVGGVLVCGDIAYSGSGEEYVHAKEFLRELTDRIGIESTRVWCVPGNHDVNRSCVAANPLLEAAHAEWREAELATLDGLIERHMEHPLSSQVFLEPIAEYNDFAAGYECSTNPNELIWRHNFQLNDGSCLRLNGLNSTIISDARDDEHNLVLGQFQIPKREMDVAHVIMCHHPPDCWLDAKSVESGLNARANVHLYGHKHLPRFEQNDNILRISSGAFHPDRRVPTWKPCFNWLSMYVVNQDGHRALSVDVYPHVWDNKQRKFVQDTASCAGDSAKRFSLELEPRPCHTERDICEVRPGQVTDAQKVEDAQPTEDRGNARMNRERTLTYQFFSLPHVVRIEIASNLKLIKNEDECLPDYELFGRILKRAADTRVLDQLWDEVAKKHGHAVEPNPFRPK